MESVEELCSHIALINKSHKILDGSVKEIRKTFKSNTYELEYTGGNTIALSTALWTGFELLETKSHEDIHKATIRLLNGNTPNHLLQALLPHLNILGLHEIIPSMNDIFIQKVSENISTASTLV